MKKAIYILLCLVVVSAGSAHDPAAQKRAAEDPDYAERVARTKAHEPEKMHAGLQGKSLYAIRKAEMTARGLSSTMIAEALYGGGPSFAYPYRARPELRSKGTVKTLTILIDFKDMRADSVLPNLTKDAIYQNIYGSGTPFAQTRKPYDSVNAYYSRASQNQVDIQGNVLGWHPFANNRDSYRPKTTGLSREVKFAQENAAIFAMLKEALQSVSASHDFSQYDNDNDGDIDLVTILYAGPPTGWGSFWWAYRWAFYTPEAATTTFGGKRANQFVFQFLSERNGGRDFDPSTLMHETGHAFGLPDYYDYDEDVGPPGGVGKLDMMDANWANHNAFSRWLLDWIKPEVISAGPPAKRTLTASGSPVTANKAIAIFPKLPDTDAPAQELFLLENRFRIGNDGGTTNLPGEGVLIWHIVATPNATDDGFILNNSYTDRKLIRLLRSGTEKDFSKSGAGDDKADGNTFFGRGTKFTPTSTPNSSNYLGQPTGISVTDISQPGESITARIGFVPGTGHPRPYASPVLRRPIWQPAATDPLAATQPLDLDALEAAAEAAASATPAVLRGAWEAVATTAKLGQLTRQQRAVLEIQLQQWSSKDGMNAVSTLLSSEAASFANRVLPGLMDAWSTANAADAHAWFDRSATKSLLAQRQIKPNSRFVRGIYAWHAKNNFNAALANALKPENTAFLVGAVQGLETAATTVGIETDTIYTKSATANLSAEARSAIETMLFERVETLLRVDPHSAGETIRSYEKFKSASRPL